MNKYIKTEDGKFVLFPEVAVHRHVARLRLRSPIRIRRIRTQLEWTAALRRAV